MPVANNNRSLFAAALLGGGFMAAVDEIIFHQILAWHHFYDRVFDGVPLHALIHWHFLAAGCLFNWAIAGPDPAPHRPSQAFRLFVLFVSIAAHAFLSKAMYAYGWPAGTQHTIEEIRAGAKIMYYGDDFAELLLVIVFFSDWLRRGAETGNNRWTMARSRSVTERYNAATP